MAVQKSRKSRAKRNSRRNSHSALQNPSLSIDQTTGSTHRRHHLSADGYYKGKQIIVVNEVMDEE